MGDKKKSKKEICNYLIKVKSISWILKKTYYSVQLNYQLKHNNSKVSLDTTTTIALL